VGGELGITPTTVAMLAIATLAMQCGMLAYAWYGFYAHPKYRHKARWAATVIKIAVCTILLGLVKWLLIDLPLLC
jgi:peptidoglycan biosynthesis protein MviN/MurJ (putative lipid II flippase)